MTASGNRSAGLSEWTDGDNHDTVWIWFNRDLANGLTNSALTLECDGAAVSLSNAVISGSGSYFAVDLSNVSTTNGWYTLTLIGSGLTDASGIPLQSNYTVSWWKSV